MKYKLLSIAIVLLLLLAFSGTFYGMSNDGGPSFAGDVFSFKQGTNYVASQQFNVFS